MDLQMVRGRTKRWEFDVTVDTGAGPTPLDLTGATIYFTVKALLSDEDADAVIALSSTGSQISLASNTATVTLTPANTIAEPDFDVTYEWALDVVDGTGATYQPLSGQLTISPSVKESFA